MSDEQEFFYGTWYPIETRTAKNRSIWDSFWVKKASDRGYPAMGPNREEGEVVTHWMPGPPSPAEQQAEIAAERAAVENLLGAEPEDVVIPAAQMQRLRKLADLAGETPYEVLKRAIGLLEEKAKDWW